MRTTMKAVFWLLPAGLLATILLIQPVSASVFGNPILDKLFNKKTNKIEITTNEIKDGTIINADISASAAISGSKIIPDFGASNYMRIPVGDNSPNPSDCSVTGDIGKIYLDKDSDSDTLYLCKRRAGTIEWVGL